MKGAQSEITNSDDYYRKALDVFNELLSRGYTTFIIRQNIAIVRQTIGDYDTALKTLLEMQTDFPQDYRIPMRLLYLHIEVQSKKENINRDYSKGKNYFYKATQLYVENLKDGQSDPEMIILEDIIKQFKDGGW